VVAFADLEWLPITSQLIDPALADLVPRHGEVQSDDVLAAVSSVFGVTIERLLGRDRSCDIALPRQIAMFLLREEANACCRRLGKPWR
jgi:chromosomal replication initiator protein